VWDGVWLPSPLFVGLVSGHAREFRAAAHGVERRGFVFVAFHLLDARGAVVFWILAQTMHPAVGAHAVTKEGSLRRGRRRRGRTMRSSVCGSCRFSGWHDNRRVGTVVPGTT
jgi:hypothetical protein